ncbi:2760_t:CDS:2 [Entrophospora sp. SA101]|nr:2760_t:CDS:2 [Entrophospora sp. SA101]
MNGSIGSQPLKSKAALIAETNDLEELINNYYFTNLEFGNEDKGSKNDENDNDEDNEFDEDEF